MNVEIGAEATQFPEKEYINGIAVAVKYKCGNYSWGRIQRKTWRMGPFSGADYLNLCQLQSRFQHMYHGQPYFRVDLNPVPESTLSSSQRLNIWPQFYLAIPCIVKKVCDFPVPSPDITNQTLPGRE